MIAVARDERQPFTDKQIALLQNFAAQAVIAMENARLLTETREALERQTALAEILGVINSSLGSLTPVFDAILEKAHSLCDVSFICLLTYDGERFHTAAQNGLPIQFREVVGNAFQAGPNNPLWRLVHGERLVHMGDAVENNGWRSCVGYSHLFDAGSIRTMVLVSLRKHGALLGAIAAFRREVQPFTDKQIALLQNFAAQAVIAMENARLLTETREALEQQTATAEVLSVINSSPGDLAPVFDAILEKAHSLCGADRGALMTFDGSVFRAAATRGVPAAFDQLLRRGLPLVAGGPVEPLLRGEAFVAAQPPEVARVARQVDEIAGTCALLIVPLRKDNSLLGYIAAYRTELRPFTGKQIALLQNFAAQAVIAMENARLLGELRQRTEEVAELNRGLEARVAEQVDELGRVGRLKRFLAPQLAELIVSQGDEKILESHRREIVVVFCDLRGYTAFTETANRRRSSNFSANTTAHWGRWSASSRGRSTSSPAMGSWCFSTTRCPVPTPLSARSRWQWRCARRRPT
jgi:GAF domain-containing protein